MGPKEVWVRTRRASGGGGRRRAGGTGRTCGEWGWDSRSPGCSYKNIFVALDLFDFVAADEDL